MRKTRFSGKTKSTDFRCKKCGKRYPITMINTKEHYAICIKCEEAKV